MRAYSLDLRTRIVEAVDKQVGTQGDIAVLFGVSRSTVKKLLRQRRETGTLTPKPHGGGNRPKVNEAQRGAVRAYLQGEQNDATVEEVQQYMSGKLRVQVSRATAGRIVQGLGLPRKKNSPRCGAGRDETGGVLGASGSHS
jgi:transposase